MTYILLIEDNQDNADLIIRALATLGMEVRHFLRGLEGSRESGRERPAIILLDFNLPDVDGRNLILTMKRALGGSSAPPIVAVTARANHLEQTLAERFGVDAFISKPFEPKMLLETVTRLLEKAKAAQQERATQEAKAVSVAPTPPTPEPAKTGVFPVPKSDATP